MDVLSVVGIGEKYCLPDHFLAITRTFAAGAAATALNSRSDRLPPTHTAAVQTAPNAEVVRQMPGNTGRPMTHRVRLLNSGSQVYSLPHERKIPGTRYFLVPENR